ncbi:MAG: cation transporter, partial [Cyanobacteria bacterium J06648_10]
LFARATYQLFAGVAPAPAIMSTIGIMALLANLVCLMLLSRHRKDNLNMSSVWICSRNDIIANTSVLAAAGLVFLTSSGLPDLAVGFVLTVVFARSAGQVLTQSWQEMR